MRSSFLPVIALVLMLMGAGAFATWFMMSQDEPRPVKPVAQLDTPVEADKPAPKAAETPIERPIEKPKDATKTKDADQTKADITNKAKPDGEYKVNKTTAPTDTTDPAKLEAEKAKKAAEEMDAAVKGLKDRLGNGLPVELKMEDLLGGEQVDFAATISGTVTDAGGVPVPNAKVYANIDQTASAGGKSGTVVMRFARGDNERGTPVATTNASGAFTTEIKRKVGKNSTISASMTASAEGYGDSVAQSVDLKNGDVKDGVTLKLRGAGSVSGRVVDGSGRGIDGVTVSFGGNNPVTSYGWSGGLTSGGGTSGANSAVTGADGTFVINSVAEGKYGKPSLKAVGYRWVKGGVQEVVVKVNEQTQCDDFVMAASTTLKIKFAGPDNSRVMGWGSVSLKEGAKTVKSGNGGIGADGVFTLGEVPAGTFDVVINIHGYKTQTTSATFVDGQITDVGTITLEPAEIKPGSSGAAVPGVLPPG